MSRTGSDAEDYVARRFPHKRDQACRLGPAADQCRRFSRRPAAMSSSATNPQGLTPSIISPSPAAAAGRRPSHRGQEADVQEGLVGRADLAVTADGDTWIRFLRKEASLPWALLSRRIKLRGDPRLLLAFGSASPS